MARDRIIGMFLCCAGLALFTSSLRGQAEHPLFRICMDSCYQAENSGEYDHALDILRRADSIARSANDTISMGKVLLKRGELHQRQGQSTRALDHYFNALKLFAAVDDQEGIARSYNNIGAVQHFDKNFEKARSYYSKSLGIYRYLGTSRQLALNYNNFGSLMEDMGSLDSALYYQRLSLGINTQLMDTTWMALGNSHIGACYTKLGLLDSARYYLLTGMDLLRNKPDRYLEGYISRLLGESYLIHGPWSEALRWCSRSLRLAEALALSPQIQRSCECLYEGYARLGDTGNALTMLERSVALRDSLYGVENAKELTRVELNHAFEQQQFADSLVQAEMRLKADITYRAGLAEQRSQRNIFLFSSVMVLILAGGLWSRLRYVRRSRTAIQRARERSDKLLLNILPRDVAEELKEHGEAKAREVDDVSILFTDLEDFSSLSTTLSARDLVATINSCYKDFDTITLQHGLEKIKTIGDAYMAAGGLPVPRANSARDLVFAALEMQEALKRSNADRIAVGARPLAMRAGIHTGPVVAGIVGTSKFQYDLWGDTVNIASRMENLGAVGTVNISAHTYRLVKDTPGLRFIPRGEVRLKSGASIAMYFAERTEVIGNGSAENSTQSALPRSS